MSKPKVSSASWHNIYTSDIASVYQDGNDDIFFKVLIQGYRPKYFYNESAWSAVQRYVVDAGDSQGWSVFN